MGQALDRDGRVLGEAFGATKSEVFEKLNAQFRDAHEIRIRSLHDQLNAETQTMMPCYRCHKEVWALKIAAIELDSDKARLEGRETDGSARIVPADEGYSAFHVDAAYLRKHTPHVGGYYVVYKDGYKSFSPAQAFEEGYTRL